MKNMIRKTWLISIAILFVVASVLPSISANLEADETILRQAQPKPLPVFWEENFDSYDDGSSMHGQGGWKGWDNDPTWTAYVTSAESLSSPHSVDIVGDADLVHEYSGCTSGQWVYTAWQYIPDDFMGQSAFILLSDYTDGAGQDNKWAVQMAFDSVTGEVQSQHGGPSLTYVTGEWIELRCEIDLDTDWFEFYYDGDLLEAKEWTAGPNNGFDGFLNIAAVDLFANVASTVYYDDMSLVGEATEPDLDCSGDLSWPEVEIGATVTGTITVENIGAAGSELSWEIESYPTDWGTWTFSEESGTGLTPEMGPITIDVTVVAPEETETTFTGKVIFVNTDNPDDTCEVQVSLTTPLSHSLPFFNFIAERFPIIAKILGL